MRPLYIPTTASARRNAATLISAIGRVPGYLLANAVGASLAARLYAEATAILLAAFVVSALVYWYREAVLDRLLPAGR
ncbi:MAG: hypothetical protein V5A27_04025 [Halapricum sp.]